MKKLAIISLFVWSLLSFTSCEEHYSRSDVTITCVYYGADIQSNNFYIDIFDENDIFVCGTKTDYNGQAFVSLPTGKSYNIETYGLDDRRNYMEGYLSFYLDTENPFEWIDVNMNYAREPF